MLLTSLLTIDSDHLHNLKFKLYQILSIHAPESQNSSASATYTAIDNVTSNGKGYRIDQVQVSMGILNQCRPLCNANIVPSKFLPRILSDHWGSTFSSLNFFNGTLSAPLHGMKVGNLTITWKFFTQMEEWERDHPQSTFAKVNATRNANSAISTSQPFLECVSPFPPRPWPSIARNGCYWSALSYESIIHHKCQEGCPRLHDASVDL